MLIEARQKPGGGTFAGYIDVLESMVGAGHAEDGTPVVRFAGTPPVQRDLLVGADGTHSLSAR